MMKTYVKRDADGEIEFAPNAKKKGTKLILGYNMERNEPMLLADGYKIFERQPRPDDGKPYERLLVETDTTLSETWVEHEVTDDEREAMRQRLFNDISDPLFVQVQRGVASAEEYIRVIAEIKFENRYSNEQNRSFDDYFNEAAVLWNESNPDKIVALKSV